MVAGSTIMNIDRVGRISIPVDFRRALNINHKDEIGIFVDGNCIVLRKYKKEEVCVFCGCDDPLIYKNQLVCVSCLEDLRTNA